MSWLKKETIRATAETRLDWSHKEVQYLKKLKWYKKAENAKKKAKGNYVRGFNGEKIFKEKKVTDSIQVHKLPSEIKKGYMVNWRLILNLTILSMFRIPKKRST